MQSKADKLMLTIVHACKSEERTCPFGGGGEGAGEYAARDALAQARDVSHRQEVLLHRAQQLRI